MQDDATEAEWYDVTKLPPLAFDHKLIVRTAFQHLLQQSETKATGMSVIECNSCLDFAVLDAWGHFILLTCVSVAWHAAHQNVQLHVS